MTIPLNIVCAFAFRKQKILRLNVVARRRIFLNLSDFLMFED